MDARTDANADDDAGDERPHDERTGDDTPNDVPAVALPDAAIDALRAAVDAGEGDDAPTDDRGTTLVAPGFRLTRAADGYTLEIDGDTHADLSADELTDLARDHPIPVSDWYFHERIVDDAGPRGSFLRWLEGVDPFDDDADGGDDGTGGGTRNDHAGAAELLRDRYAALVDGVVREWGELRIGTTLESDGTRRYEIRHVDAADLEREHLEAHHDPLAARGIATYDEDDRYRPLKTAPSLPTGWVFPDLEARDCYETVETFYPATIANWYREGRGELDVTHWHEAIERQTGIYGVIETWDRGEGHEHVEWVAETCCVDSQCLKRREWDYDAETPLDVDGGDGAFPCREPCSLVISAARQWTKLEGERERTYEFDLTPSEKEQVEAIIDAVADGRVPEIREADVYEGANRYRTRFLRAKRFDEDGNLCGVETDPDAE